MPIKIVYELDYEWFDPADSSFGGDKFFREAELPFLPPIGTEMFISEEEMDIEEQGKSYYDCQFVEVTGYRYELGKDGGFHDNRFYVILKIRGDDGQLEAKDIGDEGKPHLFRKLLEKTGWRRD